MNNLIKSELRYHGFVFIFWLLAMPFIVWFEKHGESDTNLVLVMLAVFLSTYITSHSREKRDRLNRLLPVSVFQAAFMRLGIVVIPMGILICEIWILLHFEMFKNATSLQFSINIAMAIILFYSLASIAVDAKSEAPKRAVKKIMLIVVSILSIAMLLGVIAFSTITKSGESAIPIRQIIDWVKIHQPFQGPFGFMRYLVFVLMTAGFNILAFIRRKSYCEQW